MKFENSGLKNDQIVEDAFNYVYAHNRSLASEVATSIMQEAGKSYQQQMAALNAAKEDGQISDKEYALYKMQLDQSMTNMVSQMPLIVAQELEGMFIEEKLAPALEIQQYSDKSSPTLVAAMLLLSCVRDPADYKKVEAAFGSAISGLLAEILHIDSYPGTARTSIPSASSDAKRILMMDIISELSSIPAQLESLPPGAELQFSPGQEKVIFAQAKPLWGNDKKLDMRLADVFNTAAETMSSPFRIEVTAAGTPNLVETPKNAPFKPGAKKGPKITAGD